MIGNWKVREKQEIFTSKWIRMFKSRVLLPNGAEIDDYYTVRCADAAAVVAVDKYGNVILKEEYRYAAGETLIEIPAGMIDPEDASPLDAARRELLEETGYEAQKWEEFIITSPDPARMENRMHIFLALDCFSNRPAKPEPTEDIRVMTIPMKDCVQMVMDGRITGAITAFAILKAARTLNI